MKPFLFLLLLSASLTATAQTSTSVTQSEINDNDKTLSIRINGQRNGQEVAYDRTFNIQGMSAKQKEALKNHVLDSLGLGDTPPTPKWPMTAPEKVSEVPVTFVCPSCSGKTKLAINGNGYSLERETTIKGDKTSFPFKVDMKPGEYQYTYWQNGVEQMQLPFTVKAGEPGKVQVK